jgi:periplasmic protein TonB
MRTRWAVSLAVATLMAMSSAGALAQIGSGAGEAGGLPEVANSAPMGSKDRPVRVSSGVMSSLILHRVDPIYPEDAKVDRISGAVVMGAIVDDHGKVTKLTVVAGPEGLRDAALTAVHQWTYKPFQLNGAPVFVSTVVTVNFSLKE